MPYYERLMQCLLSSDPRPRPQLVRSKRILWAYQQDKHQPSPFLRLVSAQCDLSTPLSGIDMINIGMLARYTPLTSSRLFFLNSEWLKRTNLSTDLIYSSLAPRLHA